MTDPASHSSKKKWGRGPRRRLSDDEAHADGHELAPVLEIEGVLRAEPELVASDAALAALVERLAAEDTYAFDTEFIGEHTVYPRVCLMQIATAHELVLVDPLNVSEDALLGLWRLMTAGGPTVLVHAGLQDIEPVARLTGKPPGSVFDTQIAAAFCGHRYPISLKDLAHEELGVEMGRGLKFSQWDRRPLTPKQTRYASDDVRYLLAVHARLVEKLDRLGRAGWAAEEFERFADSEIYRTDPATRKIKAQGVSKMKLRPRTALRNLIVWREEVARARDISPRLLMPDDALAEICQRGLTDAADLKGVANLPKAARRDLGDTICAIVKEAMEGPKPRGPAKRARPTERQVEQMDEAWDALLGRCEEVGVAPSIVGSRRDLSDAVLRLLRGKRVKGAEARLVRGWRAGVVGPVLDRVIGEDWRALAPPAESP